MTAKRTAKVAIVADRRRATGIARECQLENVNVIEPRSPSLLSRAYRESLLAIVADTRVLPAAAAAGLLFRIPWVAVVDSSEVTTVTRSHVLRVALGRAAAVLAPVMPCDELSAALPYARVVARDDTGRVRSVLRDIALPPEARVPTVGATGPLLIGAWMFVDDRLTRLAIRLVKVTGKAQEPLHPHHLLSGSEHYWYNTAIQSGDRVLDIGCASGTHTFNAAQIAATAMGLDLDAREVGRARKQAVQKGLSNVRFETGDLTDPATLARFEPGSFDVALVLDVLEHLVDRIAFLDTVRRILTPDGRLILAVPNVETHYKRWRARHGGVVYGDLDHKVEYTQETIRSELDQAGFAVKRLEYGGFDTPFHSFGALLGVVSIRLYSRLTKRRHRLAQVDPGKASALRIVATPARVSVSSGAS